LNGSIDIADDSKARTGATNPFVTTIGVALTAGSFAFAGRAGGQTHDRKVCHHEHRPHRALKNHAAKLISVDSLRQGACRAGDVVIVGWMRSLLKLVVTVAACSLVACGAEKPGSIGAHLSRDNETGAVYVRDVFPGLAGEKAGLLPGDEVIMIDGFYVRNQTAPRIREMLRGRVGSVVRLTLVRGELVVRVPVTRTELRDVQDEQPKPRIETLRE